VRVRRAEPAQPIELTGHLDELRSRLIIILGVLGLGVSLCFWRSGEILAFLQGPCLTAGRRSFWPPTRWIP